MCYYRDCKPPNWGLITADTLALQLPAHMLAFCGSTSFFTSFFFYLHRCYCLVTAGKTFPSKAIQKSGVQLPHDQSGCGKLSWGASSMWWLSLAVLFTVTLVADCKSAWRFSINRLRAVKAATCSLVSACVKSSTVIVILWLKVTVESSDYCHWALMMRLITVMRRYEGMTGERMSITNL